VVEAMTKTTSTDRLTAFYKELSPSPDEIMAILDAAGVATERLHPSDLYSRDLDCHNLGMHGMLEVLADVVSEYGPPLAHDTVLDLGCGMGGPGRFLVDRFGCSVVGVDLLPLRIEIAEFLTAKTGLQDRISYRVEDATALGLDEASFSQVWMLDVGMHIRDKRALFAEIARMLQPGGLFVMHDQPGPLPKSMRPLMRGAPYIAPSLPQLIRYVEGAGMRILTWRDTTDQVLDYFLDIRSLIDQAVGAPAETPDRRPRARAEDALDAYIATLRDHEGRTGLLLARRLTVS
jgi:SAM-dependent methyltransferase